MPSEFKNTWDLMVKDQISSLFMNFVENPLIYVNLIQDLLKSIDDYTSNQIHRKTLEILQILNLKDKEKDIYKQLLNIYQDYSSNSFALNSTEIPIA